MIIYTCYRNETYGLTDLVQTLIMQKKKKRATLSALKAYQTKNPFLDSYISVGMCLCQ
jgi:hypothetical protein